MYVFLVESSQTTLHLPTLIFRDLFRFQNKSFQKECKRVGPVGHHYTSIKLRATVNATVVATKVKPTSNKTHPGNKKKQTKMIPYKRTYNHTHKTKLLFVFFFFQTEHAFLTHCSIPCATCDYA